LSSIPQGGGLCYALETAGSHARFSQTAPGTGRNAGLERKMTEAEPKNGPEAAKEKVLEAALNHVPFDGWSEVTLRAAIADSGVAEGLGRALFPRGGVDLALAYHRRGDALMADRLAKIDLGALRYSDRVARAIRERLELVEDKELVRRGTTLFALPQYAPEGAKAIWGTADAIWKALGDHSTDFNWYSKRATLSAVYGSTVLFWLGDDSVGHRNSWEFLDRRIADVMQIEKLKATVRDNPVTKALREGPFSGAMRLMEKIKPPAAPQMPDDLPGRFRT
jgi:ubiquinone biosynthesis protein COQ9